MSFEFEKENFSSAEEKEIGELREEGVEKLENYLEKIYLELKENGFPINEDCRINMAAFKGVYSLEAIENDEKKIEELERKWRQEQPEREKKESSGEKLEMLKTSIFHKFLGKDFFVMRSSIYDDVKNKVDNLIIEKETGNPVCAFDEVAAIGGPKLEEKREKILDINLKGGGNLKYGLKVEKGNGKKEIKLILEKNIPIFYLALPQSEIEKGIKEFNPLGKSDYEKMLFDYFVKLLKFEISALKLKELRFSPDLRERLNLFEKKIEEF